MRSAETSGVTAKGVFASENEAAAPSALALFAGMVQRRVASTSPVSLAVAGTAFGAAALFTLYDLIRSAGWALAGMGPVVDGGFWMRALAAFAVAAIAGLLAFRRRSTAMDPALLRRAVEGIVAAMPFGVAIWDDDGRLVTCNALYAARVGHGWTLRGHSYGQAVKRLTQGGYVRIVGEGDHRRLAELHHADGTCLVIDERPLPAGGFVTLLSDVTERRRADLLLSAVREEQRQLARRYHEEKLRAEAASRAKTSFLAHLSHDIRTPLNHIIGFADMIRHQTYGPVGDARYLTYIDMIKGSGEKLLASFARILELAELESGDRPLHEEPVSVDDLLATVAQRFAPHAGRAGLSLSLGAPCGARLLGDRFCLERMLGDLVENAIRFTPSGGRVTIAAFAAHDGVVLEVTDSGIGMSEEQLERLSQPFAFGDAAFTREHDGAGLGVAIARAIAELSGGRLAIDSRPAVGTTVAVSLPLPVVDTARAA